MISLFIAIPIILLLLTCLISWFAITSKGKFIIKFIVITLTGTIAASIIVSMPSFFGWPAQKEEMPLNEEIRIIWASAIEPNPSTGIEGKVYYFIRYKNDDRFNLLEYNTPELTRLIEIDYSREAHEQSRQIQKMIMGNNGLPIDGKMQQGKPSGKEGKAQGREGNRENYDSHSEKGEFNFFISPPPNLIPKN